MDKRAVSVDMPLDPHWIGVCLIIIKMVAFRTTVERLPDWIETLISYSMSDPSTQVLWRSHHAQQGHTEPNDTTLLASRKEYLVPIRPAPYPQ